MSFRGDGDVPELDGGEGCTAVNILKTTESHPFKWVSFMVCELYLVKKTKKEGKRPALKGSLLGPTR